jgi:rhamnogalacturonyl hydrolase YesR
LAAINIYKANLKNDYLNFAKFIFEYLDSKGAGNDDVLFKIGMTYLGREIYMATKEAKYLSSYKYYFDSLIKNNLDMVGYKGFRENKKIFHNGGNYIYIYDLRINYLMLDLILNN